MWSIKIDNYMVLSAKSDVLKWNTPIKHQIEVWQISDQSAEPMCGEVKLWTDTYWPA